MRNKILPLLLKLFCLAILFTACGLGSGSVEVKLADSQTAQDWMVKLTDVSQPATVSVRGRSVYGGVSPEEAKSPSANQRWLVLAVDLKPPTKGASLLSKEIKVVDESSRAYTALALSEDQSHFTWLKDSENLMALDKAGNPRWAFIKSKGNDDIAVTFQEDEVSKVFLLFTIPDSAKQLVLHL